jgi:hypothetical protein
VINETAVDHSLSTDLLSDCGKHQENYMRATIMYAAGDVRIENVPDAKIIEPTDALISVTRACICGRGND